MNHIWRGERVCDIAEKLPGLDKEIEETLGIMPEIEDVLFACDAVSADIRSGGAAYLHDALIRDGVADPVPVLAALAENISRQSLEIKLRAELGSVRPFSITRRDPGLQQYETWSPLGVLVHITAGNSPIVAPMAAVEGLLSGNINIIKVASNTGEFAAAFLERIGRYQNLGKFIYLLRISSKQTEIIRYILDRADCVSAWGGEEAIASIREMTPRGIPVVSWGHRISFAYVTPAAADDAAADGIVASVCRNEQQSCSSPQCVLVDTEDPAVVRSFAKRLARSLDRAKETHPQIPPDAEFSAEITAVTELHKADLFFHSGDVIADPDHTYRILISDTTKFLPSPLFRTIWISPLPRDQLAARLRGMRQYLQTAGLACTLPEIADLVLRLYRAGVSRVTPVDSMSASYTGEPHDGMYALPRFMKRVSLRADIPMNGIATLDEMMTPPEQTFPGKIQGKADYPPVPDCGTRVLMKSGGTTGDPVYCSYTENDYQNYIVLPTAAAFLASGLDPKTDVLADFLKAGNLYGGMNCFISVCDYLHVPHLNISGLDDLHLAAKYLITGRATAVLGAPSYILRLFAENHDALKEYGRVKKVFYGGEHMSEGQRSYLTREFGIELIRGVIYGSNENGTIGYMCRDCGPDVYHLCAGIQQMEILKTDSDEPVGPGEPGRILLTGFLRENGHTERYEIGDMGEWIDGDCPCGRKDPRFRLLGRYGDVMRVAGTFFNYQRVMQILSETFGYKGLLQILLERDGLREKMILCVEDAHLCESDVISALVAEYDSFAKTVPTGLLKVELRHQDSSAFILNTVSIKLRSVVDRR